MRRLKRRMISRSEVGAMPISGRGKQVWVRPIIRNACKCTAFFRVVLSCAHDKRTKRTRERVQSEVQPTMPDRALLDASLGLFRFRFPK